MSSHITITWGQLALLFALAYGTGLYIAVLLLRRLWAKAFAAYGEELRRQYAAGLTQARKGMADGIAAVVAASAKMGDVASAQPTEDTKP